MKPVLILVIVLATMLSAASSAAADARRVPEGFYGVTYDGPIRGSSELEQQAQWALMARSGVESARVVVNWRHTQPQAGQAPDLTATDQVAALAARSGIELLPLVFGTPDWAALTPGLEGSPPANVSDYAAFLRALVLRYGPGGAFWREHPELPRQPVRAWQVWNEPHLSNWWNTEGRSPNAWAPEYARLLKASKPAIEAVDPRATIVLASLADFAWLHLDRLNHFRIRRYFDVAALNLFTARPKLVLKGVRYIRRSLRRGGAGRKPIWVTETTWPAGKDRVPVPQPAWQRAWYTTDDGMAGRLGRLYNIAARERRRLRLGRVYWYTWASGYGDGDLFDYTGLVHYSNGSFERRPALAAYARSARLHQGCLKTSEGTCVP
jgi:hypothetical protein